MNAEIDFAYRTFKWSNAAKGQAAVHCVIIGFHAANSRAASMRPPELVKAHAKLDALVDKAYGRTFANDAERVAHLFNLYADAVKTETDKRTLR